MAAGVAEALRGNTLPINPPAWFKQLWVDIGTVEGYFSASFRGLFRQEGEARAAIIQTLQQAGGDGAHGIVLGTKLQG
jgi:hypothetical protein